MSDVSPHVPPNVHVCAFIVENPEAFEEFYPQNCVEFYPDGRVIYFIKVTRRMKIATSLNSVHQIDNSPERIVDYFDHLGERVSNIVTLIKHKLLTHKFIYLRNFPLPQLLIENVKSSFR